MFSSKDDFRNAHAPESQSGQPTDVGNSNNSVLQFAPETTDSGSQDYIRTTLVEAEIDPSKILTRVISADRVEIALQTGTDRTQSSRLYGMHGEKHAMRAAGLDPETEAHRVTFACPLSEYGRRHKFGPGKAVLLYDASKMIQLESPPGTTPFPSRHLYAFKGAAQKSLVAICHEKAPPKPGHLPDRAP